MTGAEAPVSRGNQGSRIPVALQAVFLDSNNYLHLLCIVRKNRPRKSSRLQDLVRQTLTSPTNERIMSGTHVIRELT